mgnify:CR=1 FL=1
MVDIKISGRKVSVSDGMRDRVTEKIGDALKVFDIQPMNCDVVLRMGRNRTKPERTTCEVTVFVRHNVVRVEASSADMYAAIDEAADKVARQLRKYKTRVIDHTRRSAGARGDVAPEGIGDLSSLIEPPKEEDNLLVREKYIDLKPMSEEQALVQTDLLGHDFYVFENANTGLINVIYHRNNGGYGIIKPKVETNDEA